MITQLLNKTNAKFIQIRQQDINLISISKVKQKISINQINKTPVSVDIFYNNKMHSFSSNSLTLLEDLSKNRIIAQQTIPKQEFDISTKRAKFRHKFFKKNQSFNTNNTLKIIQSSLFSNARISINLINRKEVYENSNGANLSQQRSYAYVSLTCTANQVDYTETRSFFDFSKIEEALFKMRRKAHKFANLLSKAKPIKKGFNKVLLDNQMAGVLAHEAIGHASEADLILSDSSKFSQLKGKKIAPDFLTISDDPNKSFFGNYFFDDFGFFPKKAYLLKNGVVSEFLSDAITSKALKIPNNAHARSQNAFFKPLVRMSNTFIHKGDYSKQELLEELKDGIYIKGMRGGSVDTKNGTFFFVAKLVYRVENSKITTLHRQTAISGRLDKTLKNIIALGKDFKDSPGFCGKGGQSVPVSDGGPHILFSKLLLS